MTDVTSPPKFNFDAWKLAMDQAVGGKPAPVSGTGTMPTSDVGFKRDDPSEDDIINFWQDIEGQPLPDPAQIDADKTALSAGFQPIAPPFGDVVEMPEPIEAVSKPIPDIKDAAVVAEKAAPVAATETAAAGAGLTATGVGAAVGGATLATDAIKGSLKGLQSPQGSIKDYMPGVGGGGGSGGDAFGQAILQAIQSVGNIRSRL